MVQKKRTCLCGTSPLESQSVSINTKHTQCFGARSAPNFMKCALNNVGEESKTVIRNFIKSGSTELIRMHGTIKGLLFAAVKARICNQDVENKNSTDKIFKIILGELGRT